MIQLVCTFTGQSDAILDRARPAVALLSSQPDCTSVRFGRATDTDGRWVLTAEFDSVVSYRRALGPFDVRTVVIPFLSEADQGESAVYEVLLRGSDGDGGSIVEDEGIVAH